MIPFLFDKTVYAKRQATLMADFEPNRDLVLLFNSTEKVRSHDTSFPYRADSSFLYLTGFDEPNSIALLWKEGAARSSKICFKLLCQPRDSEREHWEGELWGPERAKKASGADWAELSADFEKILLAWLQEKPARGTAARVYSNVLNDYQHRKILDRALEQYRPRSRDGRLPIEMLADVTTKIERQRLIKDAGELAIMQKSADINVEAHRRVMQAIKPGLYEYEMQAIVEGYSISQGAIHQAYEPICASGVNATCLHYRENHRRMQDGDLFLIDAGCEYKHYASDITRTLPVNGRYTKPQRLMMDMVAEAHQEVIAQVRPGLEFKRLHEIACEVLSEALIKHKFLKATKKAAIQKMLYKKYFTHGTSHWMGLDVHDPASVFDEKSESVILQPGMVFTVEPGLYFLANDNSVAKEFRGLGVRIEDDVVVTAKGGKMLTADLPRYAPEIEKFMSKA